MNFSRPNLTLFQAAQTHIPQPKRKLTNGLQPHYIKPTKSCTDISPLQETSNLILDSSKLAKIDLSDAKFSQTIVADQDFSVIHF